MGLLDDVERAMDEEIAVLDQKNAADAAKRKAEEAAQAQAKAEADRKAAEDRAKNER